MATISPNWWWLPAAVQVVIRGHRSSEQRVAKGDVFVLRVGRTDSSYFARVFKANVGCTSMAVANARLVPTG